MAEQAETRSKARPTQTAGLSTSLERTMAPKCSALDLTMNALLTRKDGSSHQNKQIFMDLITI